MSDTLADLASCLPSEIFSADMDDHHHHSPFLRRYDLASASSTESESDDDDISGLTRRFTRSFSLQERLKTPYPVENKRVFSGSPESTLNWNVNVTGGSQVRSSPATPFVQPDLDSWELIYAAAGQIARMKMNNANAAAEAAVNAVGLGNRRLPGAPLPPGPPFNNPNFAIRKSENEVLLRQQQLRQRVVSGGNFYNAGRFVGGRPVAFSHSAWPPVETHRRQPPACIPAGFSHSTGSTAVGKKECAGTGVFLPRNYCNIPPEPKKKPVNSPVNLPSRVPIPVPIPITATTRAQQSINGGITQQCQVPTTPYNNQFKREEVAEMLMANRQKMVMLAQQQRRSVNNVGMGQQEVVLPQEWTY